MKKCFKCDETKPFIDFYKNNKMKDGHLNKCITCAKADMAAHRLANVDKYRASDKARGSKNATKYSKTWRAKYPTKYRAQYLIKNQIRAGNLFSKPCEICKTEKTHAHHDDYAEPLNIRWLCPLHHREWHKEHGEGLNGS